MPRDEARPQAVQHRADPGSQPADPPDVRGARLHGRGAAAREDHAHPARAASARAGAPADAAGDRAAAAEGAAAFGQPAQETRWSATESPAGSQATGWSASESPAPGQSR